MGMSSSRKTPKVDMAQVHPARRQQLMTPNPTTTAIADHELDSTPTTEVVSSNIPAAAHARDPQTAEIRAWIAQQLDFEDRIDRLRRLHEQHSRERDAERASSRPTIRLSEVTPAPNRGWMTWTWLPVS
jgi:hypothetical protein